MKRLMACILLLVSVSSGLTKSQDSQDHIPATLEKLFVRLRSVSEDSLRVRINDSIKLSVESLAASEIMFSHNYSNLRYLGQITSSDSLVKIITWNLVLNNEPGRYFCYFIRRSLDGNTNKVYSLTHAYDENPIRTDTIYTQVDWYGALYYDIKPFYSEKRKCWVLLGINYSDPLMTRKIIDVLSFTPEGKLVFGKKWFDSGKSVNFRHVLEYSSSAVISLRFRSDNSIVFDHLVPLTLSGNDDRLYYGPDYSYDAYIFKNGIWSLSINIDARNKRK
jgi:hypothetical protein